MKRNRIFPFFCHDPAEKGNLFLEEIKENSSCKQIVETSFLFSALCFLISFILSALFVSSSSMEEKEVVLPGIYRDFFAGLIFFLPIISVVIFTRKFLAINLDASLKKRLFPLFPAIDFTLLLIKSILCGILLQIPVLLIGAIQKTVLQYFSISLPEQERVTIMMQLLEKGDIFPVLLLSVPVLFLAPAAEELFFRLILFEKLVLTWKKEYALWGTSILFALIHGNITAFLPLLLVGTVCQLIYIRSRCLISSILLHFSFNISTLLLLILAKI